MSVYHSIRISVELGILISINYGVSVYVGQGALQRKISTFIVAIIPSRHWISNWEIPGRYYFPVSYCTVNRSEPVCPKFQGSWGYRIIVQHGWKQVSNTVRGDGLPFRTRNPAVTLLKNARITDSIYVKRKIILKMYIFRPVGRHFKPQ
jgi:hypothetical protein